MFFSVITFQVTRSGLYPESRILRNWIPAYAGMTKWNESNAKEFVTHYTSQVIVSFKSCEIRGTKYASRDTRYEE